MSAAGVRPVAATAFEPVAKPFLKWVGGKGGMLARLGPLLPPGVEHMRYVEPFVGGGAMFFALAPQRAVLSDVNPRLINAYRQVRDNLPELCQQLELREREHLAMMAQGQGEACFLRWRRKFNETPGLFGDAGLFGAAEAAALIYLTSVCFNGLYRENAQGHFSPGYCHPVRHGTQLAIYRPDRLRAAHRFLQGAGISAASFEDVVAECGPGDFIFADPPYLPVSNTADFAGYHRGGFGVQMHRRLAAALSAAGKRGAHVLTCNSHAPFTVELYAGWDVRVAMRRGNVSRKGSGRQAVREYVFRNYA